MANSYPSQFAGWWKAANFAYGSAGGPASLKCQQSNPIPVISPTVNQSMTVAFNFTTTVDGITFWPLATTAPIQVGTDGNQETVTPASVTGNGLTGYQQGSFTAAFLDQHGSGDNIASATFGLQEAINYAATQGGGIVVVDREWVALGGTTTIYNNATLPSGVTKLDHR